MKQLMITGLTGLCLTLLALEAEATRPTTIPALVGKTVSDAKTLLDDIPIKIFDTNASGAVILRNIAMSDLTRSIDEQTRPQGESVPSGPLPAGYYVGLVLYTPPPPPVSGGTQGSAETGSEETGTSAGDGCTCTTGIVMAVELALILMLMLCNLFKKSSP